MGCGKTTVGKLLAAGLGLPFYDADDFHPPGNVDKMRAGIPLTDLDRRPWLQELRRQITGWESEGKSVVLACSALRQKYRDILGVDDKKVMTIYLQGTLPELAQRIAKRRHPYMNSKLLQSQIDTLEEPEGGITVSILPPPEEIVHQVMARLREIRPDLFR
jgi:carbohydrate kinase (thermoresistant glucokinase family)